MFLRSLLKRSDLSRITNVTHFRRLDLSGLSRNFSFSPPKSQVTRILENLTESSVEVHSAFADGQTFYGSGCVITKEGHIATAAHNLYRDLRVNDFELASTLHVNFKGGDPIPVTISALDLVKDICICKMPVSLGNLGNSVVLNLGDLEIGAEVYSIGNPGLPYVTRRGIFSCYRNPREYRQETMNGLSPLTHLFPPEGLDYAEISMISPGGTSGSGLINSDGDYFGMVTNGIDFRMFDYRMAARALQVVVLEDGSVTTLGVPTKHIFQTLLHALINECTSSRSVLVPGQECVSLSGGMHVIQHLNSLY